MNKEARDAILAYAELLGLDRAEVDDLALIEETCALLDALRFAAERDLGETPLPTAFSHHEA
jgi:hypothetical protein